VIKMSEQELRRRLDEEREFGQTLQRIGEPLQRLKAYDEGFKDGVVWLVVLSLVCCWIGMLCLQIAKWIKLCLI